MKSLRELYRIGKGPSSSHTMGPQRAAQLFLERCSNASSYEVTLYGSLAATGKGHMTDVAIEEVLHPHHTVSIIWKPQVFLPFHPNGMKFVGRDVNGDIIDEWTVYSIGGGALSDGIDGHDELGASEVYDLNNFAVLKRDDASMISIRTQVDGEFLVNYQADGLIVTTSTGSTAYNLSNGGPIIIPQSSSLCLTPVAPHSLNIRPVVINDTAEITLDVESRSHNYLVAIDGRSERMTEGTRLVIRKAAHTIKIVKQRNQRYFSTLREKLMWGADQRGR